MAFDLVADQGLARRRQRLLDQRECEIRHADVAGEAVALDLAQRADGFGKRYLRVGPVQQEEIDLAQAQPHQTIAGGPLQFARREMARPDLGRDENLAARHARRPQPFADVALVVVHFGGVDVPVAEPERLLDHAGAAPPAQFPGAEPEQRYRGAVGLNARDWSDRAHAFNCPTLAVPWRRLRRADDPRSGPLERVDLRHLGRAQRKVEAAEVFGQSLALRRARNRNDALLLEPA